MINNENLMLHHTAHSTQESQRQAQTVTCNVERIATRTTKSDAELTRQHLHFAIDDDIRHGTISIDRTKLLEMYFEECAVGNGIIFLNAKTDG